MDFDDVASIVMTKVFRVYPSFDESKGEFSHWLSKVISRAIINVLRDNYTKFVRPCVADGGCRWNGGGEICEKTPSGRQCEECPAYKVWSLNKKQQHNLSQTLPVENHRIEVESIQADFLDIGTAKGVIDTKIKERLTKHEYRIYRMLYIQGKSEAEVGEALKYKKTNSGMYGGYQQILKAKKRFVELAKEIIEEEDLA
jgi:RNA polymerase sigma factor (sigma-70 family)